MRKMRRAVWGLLAALAMTALTVVPAVQAQALIHSYDTPWNIGWNCIVGPNTGGVSGNVRIRLANEYLAGHANYTIDLANITNQLNHTMQVDWFAIYDDIGVLTYLHDDPVFSPGASETANVSYANEDNGFFGRYFLTPWHEQIITAPQYHPYVLIIFTSQNNQFQCRWTLPSHP